MNVLYLTNNAGRASTTVPTRGWFEQLIPLGLRPVMVSPVLGEFSEWSAKQGISTYQLNLPFPSKTRPWPFARALWRLASIIRKHDVDIIHCNEQEIYPIASYLGRVTGRPVVVSVHFTMGRALCEWMFKGPRRPARIFFTSRGNQDACYSGVAGIIEPRRWRVLNNGINFNYYSPNLELREAFRKCYISGDEKLIGVACALRPRKQIEHLFRVVLQLPENIKLAIAGSAVSGDESYSRQLLAEGRRLLGERLICLGELHDLRAFYNGIDLYVNTSQEEACSLSILECMSSGCPVVGYPSKTVHTQVLPDGGEIIEQDNEIELRTAIAAWLSDPVRLSSGRTGARNRVLTDFNYEKVSKQLLEEYASVLSEEGL